MNESRSLSLREVYSAIGRERSQWGFPDNSSDLYPRFAENKTIAVDIRSAELDWTELVYAELDWLNWYELNWNEQNWIEMNWIKLNMVELNMIDLN